MYDLSQRKKTKVSMLTLISFKLNQLNRECAEFRSREEILIIMTMMMTIESNNVKIMSIQQIEMNREALTFSL